MPAASFKRTLANTQPDLSDLPYEPLPVSCPQNWQQLIALRPCQRRCGTGSPPWARRLPSSNPAHHGRTVPVRASTPSSATHCSTGRSSIASPRRRSSPRPGAATTTPSARIHHWRIDRPLPRSSIGRRRHPEPLRRSRQPWRQVPPCTKAETGPPDRGRPRSQATDLPPRRVYL
jgi:hypothetical protein